ncbi:hypothetical protein RRG08_000421 [Elysia crispata]|uniref:C-type lectin domain-containing protein n=1 Tax=Elysia crispata TaxID=231223 RepID=A0AAE0ZSG1_9GAST|nr:hypothetical protein RRG08_000421 [Elysia crispata]
MTCLKLVLALCLATCISLLQLPTGVVCEFDFFLSPNLTSVLEGERQCRERGYDGLAVLNTPEAYLYALEISEEGRELTGIGIDVGLRYYADNKSLLWDDGSLAASDLPWRDGPPRKFKKDKFCRIYHEGPLLYHNGRNHKRSLCGNYGAKEARFSIVKGSEPDTPELATLVEITVSSYLSCVVRCSVENFCRAAVFKSDLFTCKLFNPNLPLNITYRNNPLATTFVRPRYPVWPPP